MTIDIRCSCRWTVTLDGHSVTADDGDLARMNLDAPIGFDSEASAVEGFDIEPAGGGFLQARFRESPVPFSETGTVTEVGVLGGVSPFLPDPDDSVFSCDKFDPCSLTLEVFVNDGEAFQARLSVIVGIAESETEVRFASLSAFVASRYADDPLRECVVGE